MKVKDFDYEKIEEYEENLDEDRKKEIISELRDEIKNNHIALHKILNIQKSNAEIEFIFDWLEENEIDLNGINSSLSGEKENYRHTPKMRQSITPDALEENEQKALFIKLDELKQKGITNESEEYRAIRNQLVEHNMKLAKKVVGQSYGYYKKFGLEEKDMEQYAMEALITAVEKFDVNKGFKFSSYAFRVISNGVIRGWIRESREHQMPQEAYLAELRTAKRIYEKKFGRELTDIEFLNLQGAQIGDGNKEIDILRDLLGIEGSSAQTFRDYVNYKYMESLDELIEENEKKHKEKIEQDIINANVDNFKDIKEGEIENGVNIEADDLPFLKDERSVENTVITPYIVESIKQNMKSLNEKQKAVLTRRFGFDGKTPETLGEIAKKYNRSNERIRQVERIALRKLRHPMYSSSLVEGEKFSEYLENQYIIDDEKRDGQIVDGIKIESFEESKPEKKTNEPQKQEKAEDIVEDKQNTQLQEKEESANENEELEFVDIEDIKKAFNTGNETHLNEAEKDTDEENESILDELYENEVEDGIKITDEETKEEIGKEESKKANWHEVIEAKLNAIEELNRLIMDNLQEITDEKEKNKKNKDIQAKIREVNELIQHDD